MSKTIISISSSHSLHHLPLTRLVTVVASNRAFAMPHADSSFVPSEITT